MADNSSPESGEVGRGLNGRVSWELVQTSPNPIPEQARLPVAFPDSGGEFGAGGTDKVYRRDTASWSFGHGHFGQNRFRKCGYLLTIYKYKNIYI